jgi:3D (Asp-Asp-Asp) domain-containing protein
VPGPAAAAGAKAAAGAAAKRGASSLPASAGAGAGRARAGGRALRAAPQLAGGGDEGSGPGGKLALAGLAGLLVLFLLFLAPFLVIQSAATTLCGSDAALASAGFQGPGSLGGVGGTGVTREEYRRLSDHPSAGGRPLAGTYVSTAYGPPWNSLQGFGVTAGGIDLRPAKPKYIVAVDPSRVPIGFPVYLWPNPFSWKGPFIAADTGGAILGARIDFYDWRGRATQYAWGTRDTKLATAPAEAGIPGGGKPTLKPPGGGGTLASVPAYDVGCEQGGVDFSGRCTDGEGKATLAAGVLEPKPVVLDYVACMHSIVGGKPIVITSGARPGAVTTSGNTSDHAYGMAADIGDCCNGFPYARGNSTASRADRIAAAAMVIAGASEKQAYELARSGGAHTLCGKKSVRVQVIWRSDVGGDHYDHVHVGLREGGCSGSGYLYTTRG